MKLLALSFWITVHFTGNFVSNSLIYDYLCPKFTLLNKKLSFILNVKQIQICFYLFFKMQCLCIFSYALADNVFRTMKSEFNNHFILISGESGAGKTEASKKILQFYAVSCPSTKVLNNVRDRLLLSNPVLEVSDREFVL